MTRGECTLYECPNFGFIYIPKKFVPLSGYNIWGNHIWCLQYLGESYLGESYLVTISGGIISGYQYLGESYLVKYLGESYLGQSYLVTPYFLKGIPLYFNLGYRGYPHFFFDFFRKIWNFSKKIFYTPRFFFSIFCQKI